MVFYGRWRFFTRFKVYAYAFCKGSASKPATYGKGEGGYSNQLPRVGYNLTLDYLNKHLAEIPRTRTVYLHCGSGYRAIVQTDVPTSQNRYDKGYSGILKKNGRTLAGNLKFYAHGKTCRVKLTTEIKIEV